MQSTLSKIQFKSFEGLFDVHGTQREIAFVSQDGDGPSVLAIRGLTVEDAVHILTRLEGGLLKGKDAAQPEQLSLPNMNGVKKDEKPKVVKAATPAPKPEPEAEQDEDEDDEDSAVGAITPVDIAAMAKMEKLRPVMELMVSRGYKTSKALTEISVELKDKIPALQEVDKKGNFEARIDRAAMVILGHE
jgi:hypothetical protein